jgi:hypothetical protein
MKTIAGLLTDNKALIVILSAFVAFILGRMSGFFDARRERKKAISVALAELLEIRFQLTGTEGMIEQITCAVGNIPEHEKSQVRLVIASLLPERADLHKRYESCVSTIAPFDPLLAYVLRSKDHVLRIVNWLHSIMGQNPQAASWFGPVLKGLLTDAFQPVLDKSILRLARKKNWLCWYRTSRLLQRGKVMDEDAMQLLKPITDRMDLFKTAAAAVSAPSSSQKPPDGNPQPPRT